MDYKMILNGKDITSAIDLKACLVSDRLGGMNDDLQFEMPYESSVTFDKYDELEVVAGEYSSGIMYIDECIGANTNESCVVRAVSSKHNNRNRTTNVWYNVTLYQLINTVARKCGLEVKLYNIVNHTYKAVCQNFESDLQFLSRICRREGYSVKCSGKYLIVFSDYDLEHSQTAIAINKSDVTASSFKKKANCLSQFAVSYYDIETGTLYSYTAVDSNVSGGVERKIEALSNQGEAERFAKGYLRMANSTYITGAMTIPFNGNLSAGTVVDLSGFSDYDARYIVYELTNDICRELTHVKLRNLLDY